MTMSRVENNPFTKPLQRKSTNSKIFSNTYLLLCHLSVNHATVDGMASKFVFTMQ